MPDEATPGDIVAFCHLPKTAGTTIVYLMRRHFGMSHVDVGRREVVHDGPRVKPYFYGPQDLRADMKLYPAVRSISGHYLHPCTDFEEFQDRLVWHTILREPVSRFRSQYLHEVEFIGRQIDFPAWLQTYIRNDAMVRHLAGELNLDAAMEILATRMVCVGLQGRFDESLLLLRHRLGLEDFDIGYPEPKNTATQRRSPSVLSPRQLRRKLVGRPTFPIPDDVHQRNLEHLDKYQDEIRASNELDIKLYDFAVKEIWPRQANEYGGPDKLERDAEAQVRAGGIGLANRWRLASSAAYRNLVYKPYLRLVRRRRT